mgnify:FL=1
MCNVKSKVVNVIVTCLCSLHILASVNLHTVATEETVQVFLQAMGTIHPPQFLPFRHQHECFFEAMKLKHFKLELQIIVFFFCNLFLKKGKTTSFSVIIQGYHSFIPQFHNCVHLADLLKLSNTSLANANMKGNKSWEDLKWSWH